MRLALLGRRRRRSGFAEVHRIHLPHGGHRRAGQTRGDVPVLVGPLNPGGGIRVDKAGNIYIGQRGTVAGHDLPAGFAEDPMYKNMVGVVLKFGPEGGQRPGDWRKWNPKLPLGFSGVKQVYEAYGASSGFDAGCICTRTRFGLDRFDRLYLPDTLAFKVSVRDNNVNEIVSFGGYGNFDAQGPGSIEPEPEIPLGWATAVAASDEHIYIGDQLNHRVVRADKTWAAEAVTPLPQQPRYFFSSVSGSNPKSSRRWPSWVHSSGWGFSAIRRLASARRGSISCSRSDSISTRSKLVR